ncbi:MAG: serine/threonine protein kinase [Deltaproteobacteria bacterium]|nr:serine/threonine protein kinase [Deltaproteobacteria bacterium]
MNSNPPPASLVPGYRLDRYELLCPIAAGGMASVWVARVQGKHGFEKLVAIKTILSSLAADEKFREMFLDEARIASAIDHPNVARILDLGDERGVLFLAMEWIDGDSLTVLHRAAVKRGERVPMAIALRIAADVAAGLQAAHELADRSGALRGVVHRDVSPHNVLLAKGMAKVIDFGIAKARDRAAAPTATGEIKGKVHYMAPEQALGAEIDRRVDVWAIGAILYELVAGRAPFEGPSQIASLTLLCGEAAAPPLGADVPRPVAELIAHALKKDRNKRFATCLELQRAIEHAAVECGLVATAGDVDAYATELLAARVEKRRQTVELALKAAAEREKLLGSVPQADSSGSLQGLRALSEIHLSPIAQMTPAHGSAQQESAEHPTWRPPEGHDRGGPQRPTRAGWILVFATVTLAATILWIARPHGPPPQGASPIATPSAAPIAAPAIASAAPSPAVSEAPSAPAAPSGTAVPSGLAPFRPAVTAPPSASGKKKRPHVDDGF